MSTDCESASMGSGDSGVYKTYGSIPVAQDRNRAAQHQPFSTGFVTCTVFETTCNLVSVLTGSGMLLLPYAASVGGWSILVVLMIMCAIFLYSFELLAKTIETYYMRENISQQVHILHHNIDYMTFGKMVFGPNGDKVILLIFGTELTLALVSFFMNIGINIHVISPGVSVNTGIVVAAILTIILSATNLKMAAYSSVIGLVLTLLTIFAIVGTGMQLCSGDACASSSSFSSRQYDWLNLSGLPVALGLISFCFGGHGTL
jgi:amino acid permease